MTDRFVVIGIGAAGWDGLGRRARDELAGATTIYGSARQLDLLPALEADLRPWDSPMSTHLAEVLATTPSGGTDGDDSGHGDTGQDGPGRDGTVHILASGDPMFHGIGTTIVRAVGAARVDVIPTVSSAALACARLGWDLTDVGIVTAVARDLESVADALTDGRNLLVLSRDETTPAQLAQLLSDNDFGWSSITVLEQLGGPAERIVRGIARTWSEPAGDPLNVVAISCIGPHRSRAPGHPDDEYANDGQITKQPIRALTVSALAPSHRQLLWDIGSGSGSISIEWLRSEPTGRVIAFERDDARSAQLVANATRHGVRGRLTVAGAAPESLSTAPEPDVVFIGGGLSTLVLEAVWAALSEGGRLVANAVSLENQNLLAEWYGRHGGSLRRLSVETAAPLGTLTTWRPALPIVQWVVDRS
ncbi:precorrin-6y C5,15-methyltransferase (decarboxylating) subunit CbiE [Gordonia hankookensis]|uniref:Precorrin-6y C5,15-methyltransferase (Decarboxylating) subunit CbiE n=1 Tax=Gordonia hankookensis TaxID=589403 RepID=A0ABR7WKH5_9ACTN|nr:precorrin-6y C5,15-methyltransferase (decarboxylating) subunit CbiE [Gordonia hankookensis]MBD1322257.1 precorrin-6y C5,15-methyltransferase (decarboxylating) subunit CbiE [Gordonia hankookensis]